MNIFEQATRGKFRFDSVRGELTVENLWDLPLKSKSGLDLDAIAKAVNESLKSAKDESFVETKPNKEAAILEAKLEIVKFVIADKQAAVVAAEKREANRARRQKLLEALERKDNDTFASMSKEELLAELEKSEAA